jgi:hypothetical protein
MANPTNTLYWDREGAKIAKRYMYHAEDSVFLK